MTTTSWPPAPPTGPRALPVAIPARVPAAPGNSPAAPVHLVPTLLGALAVLAATLAIPPMISGGSWFWPTVEVVMVIWLVGVGARLARVPAAVVVVLQVIGAGVALTALFTVGGIGGVIPNGAVLAEAGDLLTGAWEQIRATVSPAPSSVELSFLICLSVGATALVVDILIAVCRAPALVALPLLCVYSVPASIDLAMLPWAAFAAPALLYAILLTASGLSGRRLGAGAGLAQVVTGVGLASIAVVVALVAAQSFTFVGTAGRLPRTTAGPATAIGLSPFASLSGSLQRADPIELFRVYGLAAPHYLRTIGLQKWTTGDGWSVDNLTDGELPNLPLSDSQDQITITSSAYRDKFLPIYSGTASLSGVGPGWSYDAALQSVHRGDAVTPDPYQVWATFSQPSGDQLRADTVTPGGSLTETGTLPAEVVSVAQQVTAGATTAFDKANALLQYFTNPVNGFSYSLNVPAGNSGDPLVDFLNNKQGFCEQYASAMAIMLRAVGVPARVAIGFTQGTRNDDGSYVISSNDAHAWVEVLFNGAGWVQFDPTPLGGGQGGEQGFTEPDGAAAGAAPSAVAPTAGLNPDDNQSVGSAPAAAAPSPQSPAGDTAGTGSAIPATVWWLLVVIALAATVAAGPTLVRNRRRRSRLGIADAGGPDAAAAAWREIEDLAVDHRIALNPAESARATANRLAKAARLTDKGRSELRALVTRAELAWYGGADPEETFASTSAAPPAALAGAEPPGPVAPLPGAVPSSQTASGSSATSGSSAALAGGGSTAIAERPTGPLGDAARAMARELQHSAPLRALDRLVPRSVRPAWWRD
ncbi:MAG TPA: DUF3488 and transglutaminase-like domain-containing protein [Nakamurella sp.]